jgi:hypothetical protein
VAEKKVVDIAKLIAEGYAVTSSAHRIVARVDRPDWLRVLEREAGMTQIQHGLAELQDHYRRIRARDRMTLPEDVDMRQMPNSSNHYKEYEAIERDAAQSVIGCVIADVHECLEGMVVELTDGRAIMFQSNFDDVIFKITEERCG